MEVLLFQNSIKYVQTKPQPPIKNNVISVHQNSLPEPQYVCKKSKFQDWQDWTKWVQDLK